MPKKLSKQVLSKIKKEKIKPTPKWEFLLKKSALWTLLGIIILIGAFSTSVILFLLETNDWEIYERLEHSLLGYTLMTLPYFWFALLAGFIALAYYDFRKTEKGYRYKYSSIILGGLGITLIAGVTLHSFDFGKEIDDRFLEHIPFYEELHHNPQVQRLNNPEKGILAGYISELSKDEVELEDFNDQEWDILLPAQHPPLREGMFVKMIGEKIDDETFRAEKIGPLERKIRRPNFVKENQKPPRTK